MEFKVLMMAFCLPEQERLVDVPENEIGPSTPHNLSRIFYWGQNMHQERECPSVSVNDVIVLLRADGEEYWLVAPVGFKCISEHELGEHRKKMVEYLGRYK